MSESRRDDDGQRSWWEKPDAHGGTPAEGAGRDPRPAGSSPAGSPPADEHDPYRSAPAGPQQSYPGGQPGPYGWPQHDPHQHGQHQYGQQQHAPGQHAPGQYPPGQHGQVQNQTYGQYGGGYGPPVAGQAQAVMWTGIGSLVLFFLSAGTLGFIAGIVSLVMAPGARRQVEESHGRLAGLHQIRIGRICSWITLGLTVLAIVGLVLLFVFLGNLAYVGSQFDPGFQGEMTRFVLAP